MTTGEARDARLAAGLRPGRASRSLGRLLGLESLLLLPLLREADSGLSPAGHDLVERPDAAGIVCVGVDDVTLELAAVLPRHGRRLLVVLPVGDPTADSGRLVGWLDAMDVPVVRVAGTRQQVAAAAEDAARDAGMTLVVADGQDGQDGQVAQGIDFPPTQTHGAANGSDDVSLGLMDVLDGVLAACQPTGTIVGVGGSTSDAERVRVLVTARRTRTLALPFAATSDMADQRVDVLLGVPAGSVTTDAVGDVRDGVLTVRISPREARAAQRLLAREECVLVSESGALGAAALFRVLADDRARKPRERRLRSNPAALVVLMGRRDAWPAGPPLADDVVQGAPVRPADLATLFARGQDGLL